MSGRRYLPTPPPAAFQIAFDAIILLRLTPFLSQKVAWDSEQDRLPAVTASRHARGNIYRLRSMSLHPPGISWEEEASPAAISTCIPCRLT
jgi:hypothetical protein